MLESVSDGVFEMGMPFCAEFHLPLVLNVRLSPLFHAASDKKLCRCLGMRLLEMHVFPAMIC